MVDNRNSLSKFISGVYLWMFLGLIVSGITGYITSKSYGMLRFVSNNMFIIIITELIVVIAFSALQRKVSPLVAKILFILYVIFIVYFLLFSDWYGRTGEMREYHYNLVLFKEIKRFWQYREQVGFFAMFTNLFGNVIIFIPFGFFLPMGSRQRSFIATAYYSFVLSLCVEVFQLITKVGSFDVDDLLLNTIGGICGYILFAICAAIRRRHAGKKTKNRR